MSEVAYDRELASIIDHTLLKPEATKEDFDRLVEEAKEYRFRSVCVHSSNVEYVAGLLQGSEVIPIAVVGFPHGQVTSVAKAFEAHDAIVNRGAKEIDMVINISALKSRHYSMVLDDIQQVVRACDGYPVKVILETASLTGTEKICGCCLAKAAGARFIKTSTGTVEGGATVEDIRLIREVVGDELLIKASGGIKTRQFAHQLMEAGANRIGTSHSVELVRGEAAGEGY
jgi:deoxyribose-phosphate aldolase